MKIRSLKWLWNKISFTKEDIERLRRNLEEQTSEQFKEFEILRRKTLEQTKNIILD